MPARIPATAAGVALMLGVLPVTEHVTDCRTAAPCPSVHTIVVLPERIVSGLVLASLAHAVASVLTGLVRAASRAIPPGATLPRIMASLALAVLVLPVSAGVGVTVSYVWGAVPRTTGWADLPVGVLAGVLVAGVLLGCAVAPWLRNARTTAAPEPA